MKYQYGTYSTYSVKFFDGVKLKGYSTLLALKRLKRRGKLLLKFTSPVLWLLPVWAVFFGMLSIVERQPYFGYFVECKYSIFTSIVIASIVRLQDKIPAYRKGLRVQHDAYTSLMYDTEGLINVLLKDALRCDGKRIAAPSHSCYTFQRWRYTSELLEKCTVLKLFPQAQIKVAIQLLLDDIEGIRSLHNAKMLQTDSYSDSFFEYELNQMRAQLITLREHLDEHNVELADIVDAVRYLFNIVGKLRYPWRRDNAIDRKRRELICKNVPNESDRGYYLNLFSFDASEEDQKTIVLENEPTELDTCGYKMRSISGRYFLWRRYADMALKSFNDVQDAYCTLMNQDTEIQSPNGETYRLKNLIEDNCLASILFSYMALDGFVNTFAKSYFRKYYGETFEQFDTVEKWSYIIRTCPGGKDDTGEIVLCQIEKAAHIRAVIANKKAEIHPVGSPLPEVRELMLKDEFLDNAYEALKALADADKWIRSNCPDGVLTLCDESFEEKINCKYKSTEKTWSFTEELTVY